MDACGTSFAQNTDQLQCSLDTGVTLDQVNSDYVVAMNRINPLGTWPLTVERRSSSPPTLFIDDGCERCAGGSASSDTWDPNSAPGLDLSYAVLSELSSSACADRHIDITWEIVDETLYNFDTNGSGTPQSIPD